MLRLLFNFPRIFRILWVFTYNRLWFGYKKDRHLFAIRLLRSLEQLGPCFIKLGQSLSVRPDVVGADIAKQLGQLQDRVVPFAFELVEQTIKEQLERDISSLFKSFNPVPIAAASIAQVHIAETFDNKEVAVKVLRPKIEKIIRRDMALLYSLASLCQKYIKSSRRLKPIEVVKLLEEIMQFELDLRLEAAAADEMKDNFANDNTVKIPDIYWQLTTKRVLTMECVRGISVTDHAAIAAAGIDNRKLATNIALCFFNQAYRDGFFHGDLHPGNIFVGSKGEVILIDFGITGRLSRKTRIYLGQILHAFLQRNYYKVAQIHLEADYIPRDTSLPVFAQACRSIGESIIGLPVNQISVGKLLAQLFEVTKQFSMETQPQLLLFQKTMMLVEGVGNIVYADVNMWKLAEPWIEEWAEDYLGVEAHIRAGAEEAIILLKKFPDLIHQLHLYLEHKNAQHHNIDKNNYSMKKHD